MSTFLVIDGNSMACKAAFAYNPKMYCPKDGKWRGEWNETKSYVVNDVVVVNADNVYLCVKNNTGAAPNDFEYWSLLGGDLKSSNGKLTGATFRFVNMLNKLLMNLKPTHVVVGWDVGRAVS